MADEFGEITDNRKIQTLAQKRSFFVRMVSDPKIYNPAINKAGTPRVSTDIMTPTDGLHNTTSVVINSPTTNNSSWISWPLAFLFNSNNNEDNGSNGKMPLRFRHLDTKVRPSPSSRRNSATGSSSSPENEYNTINNSKSPKRSPVLQRKN